MGAFSWFPVYDGNPYTYLGTYASTAYNNGAVMPLGSIAQVPSSGSQGGLATAKGSGSTLIMRYVRYNSTANPAVVAGPAPVYYTDETQTVVSGVESEGVGGANSIAGLLLPNSTSISGFTAAQLNGNFVWVGVSGFVPAISSPASIVAGDVLVGASGNFTLARIAQGSNITQLVVGIAQSSVASNLCDIILTLPIF